jgi:hypothetical protein
MCVVVPLKRGSIYVTIRLPATAGPIIMAHLIGHTSRQSSRTRPKGSPSQTAELCSSGICRRRRRRNAEFGLPTSWRIWFPQGMKADFSFAYRRSCSRRAHSFSPVVQRRKREFLSIQTFTRVCRTETKRWLARDKFVLACHEPLSGSRGVRPIEKFRATWAAGRRRPGLTFTT